MEKKKIQINKEIAIEKQRIDKIDSAIKEIEKYGGERMYFAPPIDYDRVMKSVPFGKVITIGQIRDYFARANNVDFTDPITAGNFVSIVAWASEQRYDDKTPYWRTLKANCELNQKYPGGIEVQKENLESEGHSMYGFCSFSKNGVIRRVRSNFK